MVSWSTDVIREAERFSFWREAVCQSLYNISPEAFTDRFSARMTARTSGPFRFATCESTSYEIVRSWRDISGAPADHYTIYLQLRGQTVITQRDESVAFDRNDMVIFDGRQPFRASLSDGGRRAIAVLPSPMVDRRAPWLRQNPLRKLSANSPFTDLARRHVLQLISNDLSESETSLLADNLCNLVALATATDVRTDRLKFDLQTEALLTFCRQNLHNSELSPQMVASHFGISVRTLHLRFEKTGQSLGRWLLENRLDAASKTLRDPYQRKCSISEIAYRWGFNDLSHFNKSFRTRFGMPPSQWRDQSPGENPRQKRDYSAD